MIEEAGLLASSFGKLIGIKLGRGIGLMYILLGAFILTFVATVYSYPRLRKV